MMLLLILVLLVVAIATMTGGPAIYRRRSGRVVERVYEDDGL